MKKRVLQLLSAFALVCVSSPVVALQASQSVASAPGTPPGLSMQETEAWIKRELRPMGSDQIVTRYKGTTWADKYEIESAALSECVLTIGQVDQHESRPADGTGYRLTNTSRITMKDVDVSKGLQALEDPASEDSTQNKPSYQIEVLALSDRGAPFVLEFETNGKGKIRRPARQVFIRVGDQKMGNQAGEVFRRAAVLCGAPSQPVETSSEAQGNGAPASPTLQRAVQSETQSPASSQSSAGAAKMTNDDVIHLVTAGLSEQVVTTSIRQAPAKNFDLTPTGLIALKKGGVSDALIVVMQERATPIQTPAPSEAKAPTRYDASLGAPPKPAADQNGCAGVESMGLYKNEIFSREMGGGVVEWLAKIRNNTGVTKIVNFGWRDVNGQQQTSQVQIRGGEIASPRLDMTQARVIPPISEVQVLSCQ